MGTYTHAVDHKGRVNVPTKFRKHIATDLDEALIVTRGVDDCLTAYPYDDWERVRNSLEALPKTQKNVRIYVRELLSKATAVSIDRQGRIALPKVLLDFASIGSEILMLGNLGHFELWDPATYKRTMDDESQTFEEIAESILT